MALEEGEDKMVIGSREIKKLVAPELYSWSFKRIASS